MVTTEPVAPVVTPDAAGTVALEPTPTLRLEVRGMPRGARVWIDATSATPRGGLVSGTVAPGRHVIRVEARGYEPYRREIEVHAATVLELELTKVSRARRDRSRGHAADAPPDESPASAAPVDRKIDPNGTIEPF